MEKNSSGVTIVVRLIRSFEHRTIKPLVLKNISLQLSTEELMDQVTKGLYIYI